MEERKKSSANIMFYSVTKKPISVHLFLGHEKYTAYKKQYIKYNYCLSQGFIVVTKDHDQNVIWEGKGLLGLQFNIAVHH